MEPLEKLQLISQLKASNHFEVYLAENYIHFDDLENDQIARVFIDRDYCEIQWQDFTGSTHYDWRYDTKFLKDMFWAHVETIELLEP